MNRERGHQILDSVREGVHFDPHTIAMALKATGDLSFAWGEAPTPTFLRVQPVDRFRCLVRTRHATAA